MGQPPTAKLKHKHRADWWVVVPGILLILVGVIFWREVSAESAYNRMHVLRWYCDGQQEFVQVVRWPSTYAVTFNIQLPWDMPTAFFLFSHGKWQAVADLSDNTLIAANDGSIVIGSQHPQLNQAQRYTVYHDGHPWESCSGKTLCDAAQVRHSTSLFIKCIDAAASPDGRVDFELSRIEQQPPGSTNYFFTPAGCSWDGSRAEYRLKPALPAVRHTFRGGYAWLKLKQPFKQVLMLHLDGSAGQPAQEREIDLQDPVNKGYSRISGFYDGTIWMMNITEQKAVRRDLATWQVLDRRDLQLELHRIPAKLLRQVR